MAEKLCELKKKSGGGGGTQLNIYAQLKILCTGAGWSKYKATILNFDGTQYEQDGLTAGTNGDLDDYIKSHWDAVTNFVFVRDTGNYYEYQGTNKNNNVWWAVNAAGSSYAVSPSNNAGDTFAIGAGNLNLETTILIVKKVI